MWIVNAACAVISFTVAVWLFGQEGGLLLGLLNLGASALNAVVAIWNYERTHNAGY